MDEEKKEQTATAQFNNLDFEGDNNGDEKEDENIYREKRIMKVFS